MGNAQNRSAAHHAAPGIRYLEDRFKVTKNSLTDDVISEVNKTLNSPESQLPQPDPSIDELLEKCRITLSDKIEEPPICIEFLNNDGSSVIVGTLGNFLAIIGKAKSRKTFLVSLFVAAFIARRPLMDKIRCVDNKTKNKVLLFDTEQSSFHVQKVLARIVATAEVPKESASDLEVFCLRTFPPKKRLELIRHKITNTPGLALVVIDGIKDLAFDINDGKEATEITSELMRLSEEAGTHIVVVIHQNKGDNNARGHLGTEVVNKAETVISVAKDASNTDLSIVTPEFCRDKEFEPFAFSIDQKALPYIVTDWKQKGEEKKERLAANNIPDDFHKERLKEAFKADSRPSYGNAWQNIQAAFLGYQKVSDNKVKGFLSYYQLKGWVNKVEPPASGKSWAVYTLNIPV